LQFRLTLGKLGDVSEEFVFFRLFVVGQVSNLSRKDRLETCPTARGKSHLSRKDASGNSSGSLVLSNQTLFGASALFAKGGKATEKYNRE
jgi:hypothetical protein